MIAEIGTAITAIKAASEAIRFVTVADKQLAVAELKVHLTDALTAMAEARTALLDANDQVRMRDDEIGRLNKALETKAAVKRYQDAYFEIDDKGNIKGSPYCMNCFEQEHRLVSLARAKHFSEPATCPRCRVQFAGRRVERD